MAKDSQKLWNRLTGRRVCFSGKFDWGVRERLVLLAREHGATTAKDVNAKLDFLVAQHSPQKALAQRVKSLNAKGATIQVLDADDFEKMITPTPEEAAAIIRRGPKGMKFYNDAISNWARNAVGPGSVTFTISGESFAGLDLRHFDMGECGFESCDFSRAKFERTEIRKAARCKFDNATGKVEIAVAEDCSFRGAKIPKSEFSDGSGSDFTGADLTEGEFNQYGFAYSKGKMANAILKDAKLKEVKFDAVTFIQPDFSGADLSKAYFENVTIDAGDFRKATLAEAMMGGSKFKNCDFRGADLRNANLVDGDLAGANFDGADLTGANLRGAKIQGVDLSKAKGYQKETTITVGPALKELDKAIAKAKRIKFEFHLAEAPKGAHPNLTNPTRVTGDSSHLPYGWGMSSATDIPYAGRFKKTTMSDEMLKTARVLGDVKIRFETLQIQQTKSKLKSNEFREVLTQALCEAFSQEPPDENQLAGLVKSHRKQISKATAGLRRQRQQAKKRQESAKQREAKKMEQKVAKAVGGKVTDLESFLKALAVRADGAKIQKATSMLKAESFQLYNDVTDTYLSGVVKSQTDPDLVYACRLESDGKYSCCTQNLNICGGLRGSVCKHLLVLIIGLAKAGKLDAASLDEWLSKTHNIKPALDREAMGEIFIRYKGAEAGEVDWRPTETVPEDYYAL